MGASYPIRPWSALALVGTLAVEACGARTGLDLPDRAVGDAAVDSAPADPVVEIAVGRALSCTRRQSGAVICYGTVFSGAYPHQILTRIPGSGLVVAGLPRAIGITAGLSHACAVVENGSVWCWGAGAEGELGNGAEASRLMPVPVVGVDDATQVSTSGYRTCALRGTGAVSCWGEWDDGLPPVDERVEDVPGVTSAQQITVGAWEACATTTDHRIQCWGYGGGALGVVTDDAVHETLVGPFVVTGIENSRRVDCNNFSCCSIALDGSVSCWGDFDCLEPAGCRGPLASANFWFATPTPLATPASVVSVDADSEHGCFANAGGATFCWGNDEFDELGDGTGQYSAVPVRVRFVDNVVQVSLNGDGACGLEASGTVVCWGRNDDGNHDLADVQLDPNLRYPSSDAGD